MSYKNKHLEGMVPLYLPVSKSSKSINFFGYKDPQDPILFITAHVDLDYQHLDLLPLHHQRRGLRDILERIPGRAYRRIVKSIKRIFLRRGGGDDGKILKDTYRMAVLILLTPLLMY